MKLLIALATTVALIGPAAATDRNQFAPEVLGRWCPKTNTTTYVRAAECSDATVFWQTGYDKYEQTCRYVSVTRGKDPRVDPRAYNVTARCTGTGKPETWIESFDMLMYNGELSIINHRWHDRRQNELARWFV
jgi:hypothetical protein